MNYNLQYNPRQDLMRKLFQRFKEIIFKYQIYQKLIFLSILSIVFLFFNFYYWQNFLLGVLFFSLYLIINSLFLGGILSKFLNLEKFLRFPFGLFLLLYLISFFSGIFITFYKIIPFFVFGILLFLTLLIYFVDQKVKETINQQLEQKEEKSENSFQFPSIGYWLLAIGYLISLFLLFKARTGSYILTPWEVIPPVYLYFFALITFLLILLIFSQHKTKTILIFIILHSLLLHSYLPIVYQTGFGGDKWRHLASEKYLQEGNVYSPSLFGEKISYKKIGFLKIPEVFVVGNKTSYANQWGLTIVFSWLLNKDVFYIDLILGFLLFSIFLPLFLFKISQLIYENRFFNLLTAFLPSAFYPFQIYGSITLPQSFGFLPFLFVLFLWLNYLKSEQKDKLFLLSTIFLSLSLYLNYLIYFILTLVLIPLIFLLKRKPPFKKIFFIFYFLFFIFLFPLLDTLQKTHFEKDVFRMIIPSFWQFIKEMLAIEKIKPAIGFITQGNLIFTQTIEPLSKMTLLNLFPFILIISLSIWFFVFLALIKFKGNKIKFVFSFFLIALLLSYFISFHLMEGNRILTKRLDLTIAFLMLIFLGLGLILFVERFRVFSYKAKIYALAIFLALASTSVYASGPKLEVVTKDELESAKYVWQDINSEPRAQSSRQNYCVLANTWPLLAVEYASARRIIGGGFPVYYEYAQPERVQLFKNMSLNPSIRYMKKALEITKAEQCYFMTEERWWNKRDKKILDKYKQIFGDYKKIGDVYIFKFLK